MISPVRGGNVAGALGSHHDRRVAVFFLASWSAQPLMVSAVAIGFSLLSITDRDLLRVRSPGTRRLVKPVADTFKTSSSVPGRLHCNVLGYAFAAA